MKARYIIYQKSNDKFVSNHDSMEMSEFPQDYEVFDSLEDAKEAIERMEHDFNVPYGTFEIEIL